MESIVIKNQPSFKWGVLQHIMGSMFSERAIEFGNILDQIHDEYEKHILRTFHPVCTLSGSIAEGMPIFNDVDYMMIQNDMLITEVDDSITFITSKSMESAKIAFDKILFKMDSRECYPGYTRLELISSSEQVFQNYYCEKYNEKFYLNSHKYFWEYNKGYSLNWFMQSTSQKTGPALIVDEVDYVFAISSSNYLDFSDKFLNKIPLGKYKCSLSVDKLRKMRICVVSKAHEDSTQSSLEFRLSFSLLEKLLVKSFTCQQKYYYCLLKTIYRINLKNTKKKEKGFSSYHLKNLMFWTISKEDASFWKRPMMEVLPCLLFEKLKSYVKTRCPNYFIPENKMILNYTKEELDTMLTKIDWFQEMFWEKIVFSPFHGSNILSYFFHDLKRMTQNYITIQDEVCGFQMSIRIEHMACLNRLRFFMDSLMNILKLCYNEVIAISGVINVMCDLEYSYEVIFNCRVVQQRLLCLLLFDEVEKCKDNRDFQKAEVLNGFVYCIILLSVTLTGALDDKDIGGNMLLGLFYYINKNFTQAKKIFEKLSDSKTWNFIRLYAAMPLLFLNSFPNQCPPRYFRKNKMISRLFFERNRIYLEPVSLALYLLIEITNEDIQKSKFEKKLREYERWIKYIDRPPYRFVDVYNRMLGTV